MVTVGETEILKDAVVTEKIKDANVTTAKILDANVTTAKLANNAVTEAKIANDAVKTIQLSDRAGSDKLRIKDEDGKIVFLIDSKGNVKFTGSMSKTISSSDY